jgi:hypothetical protein
VLHAPAGAEPELGLAERLGPVLQVDRQRRAGPQHPLQRDGLPTDRLRVHGRLAALLDRAEHADADAEHVVGRHRGLPQHLAEPVVDLRDHRGRVGPGRRKRMVRGGQRPHRQVEHLDPGAGLADVHTDHVGVAGVDPQQRARPAAVGVDQAGLDDQALLDELTDDVAHRALTQPAGPAEVLPALRLAQVEAGEQDGPVVPPQVADRTPHLHVAASSGRRRDRSVP